MNRNNKSSKITLGLITISMSILLLVGCKSSAAKSNSANQGTAQGNYQRPDPAAMKKQYQDALKGLVADGTIKQVQSDKVLVALTKNISKTGTQVKAKNTTQNGQQGNAKNYVRPNPLSALVTSKVITQAQSDTILQKTRGNFNRPQS
ncbi:MAG TPA: hypothetical protein VIM70_23085 [Clostridium sp.]|uniref:hypothetical protein n=1 Tax=Clostridium sp. TaxID=1506 RepID=UPI002F95A936